MDNRKKTRIKLIFTAFISILIGTYIILGNFKDNIIFFYSPSEIKGENFSKEKIIRIGGLVKAKSINYISQGKVSFQLTDEQMDISVIFQGTLPPMFREGQGIVAKGKLIEKDLFQAEELLTKHDENYMPKEVVDSLKKSGNWKE